MPDYPPGWVADLASPVWIPNEDGSNVRAAYWNDQFITPESPVTTPRTCEPGPGSLDIIGNAIGWSSEWFIDCNSNLSLKNPDPLQWTDAYIQTESALTRANGLSLFSRMRVDASSTFCFGFSQTKTGNFADAERVGLYVTSTVIRALWAGVVSSDIGTITFGVDYDIAMMLKDSGLFILVKGGDYTDWTLLWVENGGSAANLYASFWLYQFNGHLGFFEVSQVDPLEPIIYDDFNRPDRSGLGYSCDGGIWSETGLWNIVSNRAIGSAAADATAVLDSGATDYIAECVTQAPSGKQGLLVRRTNASNYIQVAIDIDNDLLEILEIAGGILQGTNNTAVTLAANTDYHIEVVVEGDTVVAYLDNGNRLAYTITAPANLTGTNVGLIKYTTQNVQFDNFYVWPRTLETL